MTSRKPSVELLELLRRRLDPPMGEPVEPADVAGEGEVGEVEAWRAD